MNIPSIYQEYSPKLGSYDIQQIVPAQPPSPGLSRDHFIPHKARARNEVSTTLARGPF